MRFRRRQEDGLQADVGLIRQQLDEMLGIFAEVGVRVTSAAGDAVEGVPPPSSRRPVPGQPNRSR